MLHLRQGGIRGDLHRRDEGSERGAATGGEQHDLATGSRQGGRGHQVVARGAQQVQAVLRQAFAIAQDTADRTFPALLRAAERFFLQGGDAARLVARRGILVHGHAAADEVLLEVVDQAYGLVEQLTGGATVHQQGLGAEHFGDFRQHGRAALGHNPIGKDAQQRVGGNAGKAVGATALQAHPQFAHGDIDADILPGMDKQFPGQLQTVFHLVLHLLADEHPHAGGLDGTHDLAEGIQLVVLASEADHQDAAGVRVMHHIGQDGPGVFVVVPQLRAAVVVREGYDGIHRTHLAGHFLPETAGDGLADPVHASHRGDDPDLVAHAHLAVLTDEAAEGAALPCRRNIRRNRIPGIVQQAFQVGFDTGMVYRRTGRDVPGHVTDGGTVFDDVLPFPQIFQQDFVSAGKVGL